MRHRFDPDVIVAYALQGWATGRIAEVLGCSKCTVRRVRRANGCQVSPPSRYDATAIVAYTAQGWTTKQIAEALGCNRSWVRKVRRVNGCRTDIELHHTRKYDWGRVVELTKQGLTVEAIADKLSMSRRHVTYIRNRTHTTTRPAMSPLSDEQVERARQMLDDGASYAEIHRTLGHAFNDRIPGRGWTREQTIEYVRATRRLRKLVDL